MKLFNFKFLAAALFCCTSLIAQNKKILSGSAPLWITNNHVSYTTENLDKDAEDGYIDLDYEKQVLIADECVYIKRVIKIISEAGVQNKSEISLGFDPGYEKLTVHSIKIIRDGKTINKLELNKFKTIQQEKELNDFIYNGSLNAVLFLEDVRKGDVIEYSYSYKGFNPIFKGRYDEVFGTGFSTPLYNLFYKLILPKGRAVTIKNANDTIKAVTNIYSDRTVYEWHKTNIVPFHTQDALPSWYDPYPFVMVSEYQSWKQVNDWASSLFPMNITLSTPLLQKINEIKISNKSQESRLLAALRFVQDDIRYMGFEMGENSHKPESPNTVFNRRFGDCKEKSYLLACMLKAMGIACEPVLINTGLKKSLHDELPAPRVFNHTTVKVKLDEKVYWFDPTIAYQRGTIDHISYPDYQCGLVISDTTTSLTDILPRSVGQVNVKEVFNVIDMVGNATLVVTTINTGSFADDVRSDFKNYSQHEMLKSYKRFYSDYFEQISEDSISYTDTDDSLGSFATKEYYTIKDFWKKKQQLISADFYPYVIQSILKKPKDINRTMPFTIQFPAKYKEEIEVNLPEDWDAEPGNSFIKCDAFMLNAKFINNNNRHLLLQYEYESFKDHVSTQQAPEYFASIKKSDEEQGYGLTKTTNELNSNTKENIVKTNLPLENSKANIFYSLIIVGSLVGFMLWWTQKRT